MQRADLARFVRHCADLGLEVDLRYHIVSESCYLSDPDGHGVEVCWERPTGEWRREHGLLALVADPLDRGDLLNEPGADAPYGALPASTTVGHVQLKVTDNTLIDTAAFYGDLLGFTLMSRLEGRMLAFGVADDRSQVVLVNRFSQGGGARAPEASAHLLGVDLLLPERGDVRELAQHLAEAGHPFDIQAGRLTVRDPSGNALRFAARPHTDRHRRPRQPLLSPEVQWTPLRAKGKSPFRGDFLWCARRDSNPWPSDP